MKLEIGNQMYELEYTINSVCDLEEMLGKGVADILSFSGFSSVRALLWCGLIEHNEGMTIKDAGALLQEYIKTNTIEQLATVLGEAVQQAGFLAEKGNKKPMRAAK